MKVKVAGRLIPRYQSEQASGCDLYADIKKPLTIPPGSFCTLPTGIRVEIPAGYEAQVRPRSGLAKKYGIGIMNAPGTIDADYRGEIKVILFNFGKRPFPIRRRDRIAQLVFSPVVRVDFKTVKRLRRTQRGRGGFGHSGFGEKP
jgi:dUTP pyrophosphatase